MDKLWRLGLIGHPLSHSVSPTLHRAALKTTGLEGDYRLYDRSAVNLSEIVSELRRGELDGLNVTIPHKERVLAYVDRLEGAALALGAVNTLVRASDGCIEGHNTDLQGLVDALRERWPNVPWSGSPATVIGAGGAARAAVMAALEVGASEVRVTNRSAQRAERLADDFQQLSLERVVARPAEDAFEGSALVLQASAIGMGWASTHPQWSDALEAAALGLAHVSAQAVLFDLVYTPRVTPWISAARERGLESDDGVKMLVAQAAASFRLWTGREPRLEAMHQALLATGS